MSKFETEMSLGSDGVMHRREDLRRAASSGYRPTMDQTQAFAALGRQIADKAIAGQSYAAEVEQIVARRNQELGR